MHKIELPSKLTPDAAQALWYDLDVGYDASSGGLAIVVDASQVRHVSAAALQVLIVAKTRFSKDGGFLLSNPSTEFLQCLKPMGASSLFEETVQ